MIIEKTLYTPESVGYDSEQLHVLHNFFNLHINRGVLRAANYALARDGKTFAAASIGKQSYNENDSRPLQIDAIYPICSETKLITATAIFKLMEMGRIRMSQSLGEFIPEFSSKPFNDITIARLLSHTSGFYVDPHAITYERPNHYELITQAFANGDTDWIKASMGVGMCFTPGTEWGYASFGYTLLAEVIRRISGMTESEFVTKYIFEPCEMTDTSYGPDISKIDRIIINHESMEKCINNTKQGIEPDEMEKKYDLLPKGASGVFSTTLDLLKFGNMLLNKGIYNGKRVLGRRTIDKMTQVYTTEDVFDKCWGNSDGYYRRYGLGPDMRCNEDCLYSPETFFHEGAGRCALIIDPTERLVAVYLIPYVDGSLWDPDPIWNAHSVIWGGLM